MATPILPREEQLKRMNSVLAAEGWDGTWKQGTTVAILKSPPAGVEWPRDGRALVAGCGRGYDPLLVASILDIESWGIDISPTAVSKAQERVKYVCDDFFKFPSPAGGFGLAYDFTFFVALPPTMRPDWGKRYAALITQGGYLITLMWPMDERKEGPPYFCQPEHYEDVLKESFEMLSLETPLEQGRFQGSKIAVWRRK
ncbi:S-adenosyl-L-methionine-dependent methyltransferase [Atractiella rhizophila]|nr:S-adenosyl-L-methionine-dependent methyltransferase [Atractiella rhizophila]